MTRKKIDFADNIVKLTYSRQFASRSSLRNKQLAEKFVNDFINNHLTYKFRIEYDETLISDLGQDVKCDVVIRHKGTIKAVINFRFPMSSLNKNINNVFFEELGKASELEHCMKETLNDDVEVFFVTFIPNTSNIKPKNHLGLRGFKRCKSLQTFYDVNQGFYTMQNNYKNNTYHVPKSRVVTGATTHFGSFQDIRNAIYN